MKIEAIKTDNSGLKLIATSKVINFLGCKPVITPCVLHDFNKQSGELRTFAGSGFIVNNFSSFKDCLNFLLKN